MYNYYMEELITCVCKECPADNKCDNCPFKNDCDWPWISKLWNKTPNLSPCLPSWIKPDMRLGKIVTITKNDFCVFSLPKKKDYIVINDIAVGEECRGKGVSKKLIFGLMEKYDKDVFAKCIKDSSAESFWKYIGGIKLDEEQSKKTIVCSYILKNNNKKQNKEELW